MASLEQQLDNLAHQLEKLKTAIPVDEQAIGITLEKHDPGNGGSYHRLRARKGKRLVNGKRTMSLSAEETAKWQQKIYARNQQAKVTQCQALIQQAAEIASEITWDFGDITELVKIVSTFTHNQAENIVPNRVASKRAIAITHVKTKRGSLTHAVAGIMPSSGPWHVSALCGAKPPERDHYGWEIPGTSELTCGKCYRQLPEHYERHLPQR